MINKRRILGIDPGSRLTGFGVLDFVGDKPAYVASGTIKSLDGDFSQRLKQIFESVNEIVARYEPDIVAIESVFMARNAGSALKLGHARAAALCATFEFDIVTSTEMSIETPPVSSSKSCASDGAPSGFGTSI